MRTPKYRFLLGKSLFPISPFFNGYYDKITGELVTGGTETVCGSVVKDPGYFFEGYLAADNTFLKENSYLTLYADNIFIQAIQLSSIMGVPFLIPQGITKIGVTLDTSEVDGGGEYFPVYILHKADALYSKLAKKIVRENGQMFFRETLDTDLHFVGFEADIIQTYGIEDRFMLICERWNYGNNAWVVYHADTFSFTDCSFDLAAHSCKPKFTPLDNYSRLLARYSDEYDLIKLKPAITQIHTFLRPIIELYEKGSSVITRFLGGTYWETEINSPIDDDTVLTGAEHFNALSIDPSWAYMDVSFYSTVQTVPSGRYQYDPNNNYYWLQNADGFWAWSHTTTPWGAALTLSRNGNPVMSANNTPWMIQPTGYSGAADLPFDSNSSTPIFYMNQELTPILLGNAWPKLYSVYGRVVGNKSVMFGQTAFDLPQDDFAVNSPSYKKCVPLTKGLAKLYLSVDSSNTPTIYGIKGNPDEYYTNENLPIEGGLHGVRPMPVGKYEWGEGSFWFNYPDNYVALEIDSRYQYKLKDCFTIGAVIRALLAVIDPSITFEDTTTHSIFLYGTPAMKGGYWWKLAITPKSNVLKGDYDQAAQKAPVTFEELMGMLRDLYGLYWYIDSNRRLHIEHLVWFLNGGSYASYQGGVQLDLTDPTVRDAFNKKMTGYWQEAYEFNMSEAARRLELTYAEKGTEFFEGLSVDVLNSYLREASVNSKSISNFTADLDLMRIEPDRYSSDGFAVLTYTTGQTPQSPPTEPVVPVVGAVTVTEKDGWQRQAYINNLFASWLYCQHFYMYNLSGDNMKVNLKLESLPNNSSLDFVHGLARLKKQKVRFLFDNDPDTVDLIKTVLGYGMPESFEIDALSRTVDATLAFSIRELVV